MHLLSHDFIVILGSILDTFWHQNGTMSGVCRIALRCVAVRREVLCCDHLGSPSRRVAVCCGASRRVVSCRKKREMRGRHFHCQFYIKI